VLGLRGYYFYPSPSCRAVEWIYKTTDLIDYLYDKAQETGARVEVISSKTEHGAMFKSFGGVGAVLRYKLRYGYG
jgi:peptide chain release factor subunit 1